ncbi:carbohydrate porin, partial [Beijerinckia mobilis]|uniref:carbohydrate porin n=1 Tax=Beijerinckia mobilis TaxID=231434 RepID=UPI001AEBCA17
MKTIKWVMTSLVCIQTSLLFVTPHSPAYAADIVRQPSVKAGSTADDFWTRDHLFGDMGGLRTQLHDMGIDFQIGYVSESVTNWTGGKDQYVVNAGQATFGTTFDLQRLLGDPNAIFQITLTSRSGSSLGNAADLGTLMGVNELHGRGNIVRLTQFYYDQTFANGTWDWKIGRLTIGEDFAAFSCDFINLTFCGNPSGNMRGNYIYNWPVSQWGTRIKTLIPDFGYAQVGIYDVNKAYLNTAPQYALA